MTRVRVACLLDDVRQRVGHDEVRARLDGRREPHGRDVDLDGQIEPARERADAGRQATAQQDGRKDAVRLLRHPERIRDERLGPRGIPPDRTLRQLHRHDGVDQALLRSVVQVSDHAASRLVASGEQTCPRGGELVAAGRLW
jgi:hypothetical protein